jgi:pimeloyl-ACP methyl ester carboxylesterase
MYDVDGHFSFVWRRDSLNSVEFKLKGITLKGLLQEGEGTPILALHGWLDNAGSFNALCHAMPNRTILALDLAGHGLSGHRHITSDYAIWKDVPEVVEVVDQLGWEHLILLGHSRGAAIATFSAVVLKERVLGVAWIDGGLPMLEQDDFAEQLQKSTHDHLRIRRPKRVYQSKEQAKTARLRSHFKLTEAQVLSLMERGLAEVDGGYSWRSDPRLMDASPVRLSRQQIIQALEAIQCPIRLVYANDESEQMTRWRRSFIELDQIVSKAYDGAHHLHMDKKTAAKIAADLEAWFF